MFHEPKGVYAKQNRAFQVALWGLVQLQTTTTILTSLLHKLQAQAPCHYASYKFNPSGLLLCFYSSTLPSAGVNKEELKVLLP